MRIGDRLDGHIVTGHIDAQGEILRTTREGGSVVLRISHPGSKVVPLVKKGSVAINGVSLTVNRISGKSFSVTLIPETLKRTNLGGLKKRDFVNLEADILGKYMSHSRRERRSVAGIHFWIPATNSSAGRG
jgi:riboflavin synthase